MDVIPQEVINQIAICVERYEDSARNGDCNPNKLPSQLPPLATLSLAWQEAIESITFRDLVIKSDELLIFRELMTGRRRNHLAELEFKVILPTHSEKQTGKVETYMEKQMNDACFTRAVQGLFSILKTWEREQVQRAMRLDIGTVCSPPDLRRSLQYHVETDRWRKSYIDLHSLDDLPTLSNIRDVGITHPYNLGRLVLPQIAPWLTNRLPSLNVARWYLHEFPQRADRVAFAEALNTTRLLPGSKLNIVITHWDFFAPIEDWRPLPPALPYDPLSAAIRMMSQNLAILVLELNFDTTLFWPSRFETAVPPHWPRLRRLTVRYAKHLSRSTMSIKLLGAVVCHEGGHDSNGIIHVADTEADAHLAAFAKAVQNMPVLEYFQFLSGIEKSQSGDEGTKIGTFVIFYQCPGPFHHAFIEEGEQDINFRRVYYACEYGRKWRPEAKTAQALRNAGKEKFGDLERAPISDERAPLLAHDATRQQTATPSQSDDDLDEPEKATLSTWYYVWRALLALLTVLIIVLFIKAWIDADDVDFDLKGALKRALGGGLSGAAAMILQVLLLMPIRTIMNYQYRHGTKTIVATKTLYRDGGLGRYYQGMGAALIQGPVARFGDTAANAGILALLQSNGFLKQLPSPIQTIFASACAAAFRMILTPIDTLKTTLQAQGPSGWGILRQRIKSDGIGSLWWGAFATAAATFVGHYPWFAVYNFLSEAISEPSKQQIGWWLLRAAFIGFCASVTSDTISNSLRVVKTYRQVNDTRVSYTEAARQVIRQDGRLGLFGRGLKTRIIANGLQGILFSILWKLFLKIWEDKTG
ncbi:mitochondrial carrier [Pyrenophora seminiperda CCB06]|uniref:Mitochondrial carrier n=1 Tax=Pyrenophora seminiperda CCB06 TaxID=1302712 RepID=A0A3M7MJF5_9PLEO|nr:mitochondrial carrier [Pyrenophora seminiperda CCB06]